MKLSKIKIADIKKAKYNSPIRTDMKYLKTLLQSIQVNGIYMPLMVTKDMCLIDGHRRLACAEELGMLEVPAIIQDISENEKDIVYEDINTTSRKINEADQLFVFMNGGRISKRVHHAIERITDITHNQEVLTQMFQSRKSPTHTWHIYNKLLNYANPPNTKMALEWIVKFETAYRLRRAINDGIAPKVILEAIKKDKPLKQRWMA